MGKSIERERNESEAAMGKKYSAQTTKVPLLEMRKCEINPTISGYREMRGRYEDKTSYIAHGNT